TSTASASAEATIHFRIAMIASPDVQVSRSIARRPRCDRLFRGLLFRDLDRLGVRDRYPVEGLAYRLPAEGIGIDMDIDAGRVQLLAIGPDAVDINAPFLAFPGPDAAAEPTVGLEGPRANRGLGVVLADHLHPRLDDLAAFLDRVFSANEHLVLVPFVAD